MSKYSEKKERQMLAAQEAEKAEAKERAEAAKKAQEEARRLAALAAEKRAREEAMRAREEAARRDLEALRVANDERIVKILTEANERLAPLVSILQSEYAEAEGEAKGNYHAAAGALGCACEKIAKAATRTRINLEFYSPTAGRGGMPETAEARAANLRPEAAR